MYAGAERADTLPLFLLYPYMYSVFLLVGSSPNTWMRDNGEVLGVTKM
jgi:hypothetical protein